MVNMINDLAKNVDDRKQTNVIMLDFSKMFDKVPDKEHNVIYFIDNTYVNDNRER